MARRRETHNLIGAYLSEIDRNLKSRIAREQTHRHALQDLLESLDSTISVFNDPEHIAVGAPDFTIRQKGNATDFPVGWAETKDIGEDLNKTEKSEQMRRYLGLPNLLLTDYLEFRWYTDGKLRLRARLAQLSRAHKLSRIRDSEEAVRSLLSEFLRHSIASVATPNDLAERMARLAHLIRDILLRAFDAETASGRLHGQFKAFQETLIPDLTPDQFADMYAQTIAYGLFAARCQPKTTPEAFSRASAADLIPRTNPFLRKLFQSIAFDLDERVLPFVDDLVALLRNADIASIMADFGKRTAKEDPVVHFYEDFLREYDPKLREMRGVYYTPEPVVGYIVRSVDYLLKTKFGKPLGLADRDVLILDPACGTGTFLYTAIRHIYQELIERGQKGQWNSYVSENLLKRIFGFELLMAPYAVAHLKLGLLLGELGYQFDTDERLGIYLTNTLEEAIKRSEAMFAQWIADEANAAAEIKRDRPIMVVFGNPPYSGHSANKGKWITDLMVDYKRDCPELYKPAQAKWLQDDYVKFIRFGQWRIDRTGSGVLAFITNHGYLDNLTFRCMRQRLLQSFNEIRTFDLHGSSKKKETAPDGSKDENVFDIQQGVAIGVFLKQGTGSAESRTFHADLWGDRAAKYTVLSSSDIGETDWTSTAATAPAYLLTPENAGIRSEYERAWRLPLAMDRNGDPAPGIVTTQDEFAISFSAVEAAEKVRSFLETSTEEEARDLFRLCSQSQWNYTKAKKELKSSRWEDNVVPILYRPFDIRWTVYDSNVAVHRRERVMRNMLVDGNLGLVTTRSVEIGRGFEHTFCTRNIAQHHAVSLKEVNYLFPLYLVKRPASDPRLFLDSERIPNLNPRFVEEFGKNLESAFIDHGRGDLADSFGPEDVFSYMYALLSTRSYRNRYAGVLKSDFPRIPLTKDRALFRALVENGRELVSLHLMESPKLSPENFLTRYDQPGDHVVEKVRYAESNAGVGIKTGRVYINKTQYFEGVPNDIWEFHIGGYQVLERWLKDRKGRGLSSDDIDHYQKIVVALAGTIRLMREADDVIPGWPLS